MATFIPIRSACSFQTNGERRFAENLDKKLNDRYLCWFNVPVGTRALQPDFIILHPGHGLLVLEVKDWKPSTVRNLTKDQATLLVEGEYKHDKNPMKQARQYAEELGKLLVKDPLLQQTDGTYAGNLAMPWGWGVVLPNISRAQFDALGWDRVMEPTSVLCKDEITSVTNELFESQLVSMFRNFFPCNLSQKQLDCVRYHLYPELRIEGECQLGLLNEKQAPTPSLTKIMDLQQEQLARSMGSGHRIIHGVAGSGKTMILSYRARYLANLADKPVLVLCYNKTLASRLKQTLSNGSFADRIHTYHFHGWCSQLVKEQEIKLVKNKEKPWESSLGSVLQAIDDGQFLGGQYGAILIDEAHDFEPEWFRIVLHMLEPKQQNLLVLYDDAQSIYEGRAGIGFTFSSVGIQARGRTTILRTNYRNTMEILRVAKGFAQSFLAASNLDEEDCIPTLDPDSAGRKGDMPELCRFASAQGEGEYIAEQINDLIASGSNPDSIAILVHSLNPKRAYLQDIKKSLLKHGISYTSSKDESLNLFNDEPSVKLITMHSSKGLEFEHVFVAAINQVPEQGGERLLYVAMTRAIENLTLTYHQESLFVQRIQRAIRKAEY